MNRLGEKKGDPMAYFIFGILVGILIAAKQVCSICDKEGCTASNHDQL